MMAYRWLCAEDECIQDNDTMGTLNIRILVY